jgi:hypothetical protein
MTSRERFFRTLNYDQPDRLPVVIHASTAGLYVHGQKLLELFRQYPPDHPAAFDTLPAPPSTAFDAQGRYHERKTDDWGVEWEYLIFGIAGHPSRYPIADWEQADAYAFPGLWPTTGPDFERPRAELQRNKAQYFMAGGGISIFEKLHALHPMDGLLLALASEEPGLFRFLERLERHWNDIIDYHLALGYDAIWFGDDWGTQTAPIISPAMFRDIFRPIYKRLFARVKAGGARVFFHSCGALGPIFDELLDLGIDLIWPQIRWFESDPARIAACRERKVGFYVHPDRQRLIPLGTPAEIRAEIRRYADLGRRLGGGVVFYVEIENDAPFENVAALMEAIGEGRRET